MSTGFYNCQLYRTFSKKSFVSYKLKNQKVSCENSHGRYITIKNTTEYSLRAKLSGEMTEPMI